MKEDPRSSETNFGLGTEEGRRRHLLPQALVVGLVAGLLGSAFRMALQFAERHRMVWQLDLSPPAALAVALLVGGFGGGIGLWLVRRWAPEAAGSGIPH